MAQEDAHNLAALLAAAQRGDAAGVRAAGRPIAGLLQGVGASWLGYDLSLRQADSDVAQDAAVHICQQFAAFRGRTAAELVAWVRRIAHGAAVDWKRKQGLPLSRPGGSEPAAPPLPSDQLERAEEVMRVFTALEAMPERRRQVVEMRLIDHLSHAKIAQRLGASEAATRVLFYRALEQLAGLLKEGRP